MFTVETLGSVTVIIRNRDTAIIPVDPSNADYQDYLRWVVAGSPTKWP